MKYRIREVKEKYRAEIGKENKFGTIDWTGIENDDDGRLVNRTHLYDTVDEAVEACKKHHIKNGYDQIGKDIIKEFEL